MPAMAGYEAYRKTRFFASLDGLRALAILAVIWHHTGWQATHWAISSTGYLGVDLFFVISGFLITTLLLREREDTGRISLRDFYIRRALRIFPLYYTVIALYVATVYLFERNTPAGQAFFSNLPFFLLYTSNWFIQLEGRVIFYFAWSLATEEQFYLVWPTIEKWFGKFTIPTLVVAVLLVRTLVERTGPHEGFWATLILSIHPAILGGVLLAHLLHDPRGFELAEKLLARAWTGPLALGGLILVMGVLGPKWLIWTLMATLIGAAVVRERNSLVFLRWRPIAYIGTVSYGMYLLHMLCHNVVKRALPSQEDLWFFATTALTVLVAGISFRYYESRFLRLKRRFSPSHGAAERTTPVPVRTARA